MGEINGLKILLSRVLYYVLSIGILSCQQNTKNETKNIMLCLYSNFWDIRHLYFIELNHCSKLKKNPYTHWLEASEGQTNGH
jgi:hypothetical protein